MIANLNIANNCWYEFIPRGFICASPDRTDLDGHERSSVEAKQSGTLVSLRDRSDPYHGASLPAFIVGLDTITSSFQVDEAGSLRSIKSTEV